MKKLFAALTAELTAGRSAVLCSIVSSSGSAPRGAGAKMLVLEDGSALGTIGGGEMEYQAAQFARKIYGEKRSAFVSYQLSPSVEANTGMICGGDVRVFFQHFHPADPKCLPVLRAVSALLSGTGAAWLVTSICTDGSWSMGTFDRQNGLRFLPELSQADLEPLLSSRGLLSEDRLFVEPLCRAGTVYLFGGGHVGRELTHILSLADFRVAVWDERPYAAKREFLPDAAAIQCGLYDGALEKLDPITEDDYIVIMTPGHQADFTVLTQALRTPARYIGCIGSRKKAAAIREKLLAAGFSPAEIDRIHSPIGLPTGGETPAEIAISIAAQMIACRSGRLEGFRYAAN